MKLKIGSIFKIFGDLNLDRYLRKAKVKGITLKIMLVQGVHFQNVIEELSMCIFGVCKENRLFFLKFKMPDIE